MTATASPPPTTTRGDAPLLSVRDLRVTFTRRGEKPFKAVDGVSFDVRPGQTHLHLPPPFLARLRIVLGALD